MHVRPSLEADTANDDVAGGIRERELVHGARSHVAVYPEVGIGEGVGVWEAVADVPPNERVVGDAGELFGIRRFVVPDCAFLEFENGPGGVKGFDTLLLLWLMGFIGGCRWLRDYWGVHDDFYAIEIRNGIKRRTYI